ncbi:MAG: hypothetical protein AAGE38_11775, partial [Pseudomonadota bacterium]
ERRSKSRQSDYAGCSTKPLPPKLKQRPNQSLRYKTAQALRKTLTTDSECHTLADADMVDLSTGTGIAPAGWAELIKDLCINQQGLRAVPPFSQDNARGLAGDTVTVLMGQAGVPCHPPSKDRKGGWALMTQLLDGAKTGDGPGLYVHPSCEYLLATLPDAPANPNAPDDLDPKWADDHACDAAQYAVSFLTQRRAKRGKVTGDY